MKVSINCSTAEYIVLIIGILLSIVSKKLKSLFPINDKEIHPIIVIKSIAINISKPGIL